MTTFKIGDTVQVGSHGEKGRIIDIYKPLGTFEMYKVHLMTTGNITSAAKHELVKGIPDDVFQNVYNYVEGDVEHGTEHLSDLADQPDPYIAYPIDLPVDLPMLNEHDEVENENVDLPPQQNGRFVKLHTTPEQYREEMKNQNTEKKTKCHIKVLREFLMSKGETREPEFIPPTQLDSYLQEFFISVRQKSGQEYEPSTLRGMMGSFDRYLRDKNYATSIARGPEFRKTITTLASKQKELKKQGKGNKPFQAAPLTDEEINILFSKGLLGTDTPKALINLLWLNNTMQFGMRGGASEHRQLQWGDLALGFDHDQGVEYIEFKERQTKTRTGIDINNIRQENPRMYATYTDRCPVAAYKRYSDLRPSGYSEEHHPFYLATNTINQHPSDTEVWFTRGPIGKNKLCNILKTMAVEADLPNLQNGKRLTNSSARKTLCQKLLQHNIPDTHAIHITGHKNTSSLNNYRQLTSGQQRCISHILANTSSTETAQYITAPPAAPTSTTVNNQLALSQVSIIEREASCPTVPETMSGLFAKATINGGTFNIYL